MGETNRIAPIAGSASPDSISKTQYSTTEARPSAAFQSQLDHVSRANRYGAGSASYGQQQSFNMGALGTMLPPMPYSSMSRPEFQQSATFHPQVTYDLQQQGYAAELPDPSFSTRAPQPQFMSTQYHSLQMAGRHAMPQVQTLGQFHPSNPYSMSVSPLSPQAMDPHFAHTGQFPGAPQMIGSMTQYIRQMPELAPVPSYPRGPPRKPKQSGHALWVGNLPPGARVNDLKDHFSRDAMRDIESLFLISKSNCAFVNYRSEAACAAAMHRFHDSRFHGVRLVCRLRRGSAASAAESAATFEEESAETKAVSDSAVDTAHTGGGDAAGPTIVGGGHDPDHDIKPPAAVRATRPGHRVPEKYFVVKSLTSQDLESSVRNGIWATQNHNESALNQAYRDADNVFLIFSANKSGEYFGYARMSSLIDGQPVNLNASSTESAETISTGVPQAIHTPATATAPKGRIIDDSARGTIFWEAELSDDEDTDAAEKKKDMEGFKTTPGSNWGRQFSIEWISTARLPFFRTRGLRNPWNSNREVKIARDGTELEPTVGRRLVQMFHQPPQRPPRP